MTTDPTNPDTDGDGLLDGEEIDQTISWKRVINDTGDGSHGAYCIYFNMLSDPTKVDTDGDGLLDGQRVIYDVINSKPILENDIFSKSDITDETKYRIMIPIDDKPLNSSDYADVWKEQMQSMENGCIATEYSQDRGSENEVMNELANEADSLVNTLLENDWIVGKGFIDFIEKKFKDSAQGDTAEEWGSDFLDFIVDENGEVYHSQVETWQKAFGYNELYDKVFDYGSDMLFNRITFFYDNEEYILWSWKGDYWNLQSGGETGMYVYNDKNVNGYKHYDVVDFELPMTLSLYKGSDEQTECIFNWAPAEEQWWITGFNPDFTNPDPDGMTMLCSVDFETEEFYADFVATHRPDNEEIIFDEDYEMIWIMW